MPYRMPSIVKTMQAMEMVKMAFKNGFPGKLCSQTNICDSTCFKFPFMQLNNFILNRKKICVDRNHFWQVCLPKCQPQTPYIFSKKWPWSHIFEAAPCIGRIISFKVQILENYVEKNLLTKITVNTDLFCAEWSYLAAWMEIWSKKNHKCVLTNIIFLENHFWRPFSPFPWLAWSWQYSAFDRASNELQFAFLFVDNAPLVPEILTFQNYVRFFETPK